MHSQSSLGSQNEAVSPIPQFNQIVLAQVVEVTPSDQSVQVLFTTLSGILNSATGTPHKVRVCQPLAGLSGARLALPQPGEWGLVCFPNGSDQMAVWLGSICRDLSNLAWDQMGPKTQLDQHYSGAYLLRDDAGNTDIVFADGSYVRIGDGESIAGRFEHQRQGQQRLNIERSQPSGTDVTMHLHHKSGTTVTIEPSGKVTINSVDNVVVEGTEVTVKGAGPSQTIVGGDQDFVVLLAGLQNLIAWATSHVHANVLSGPAESGPPTAPPNVPIPGTDHTVNMVAS